MDSEYRQHGFRRTADDGLAVGDHDRAFDQFWMRDHGGDQRVVAEGGIVQSE